MPLRSNTQSDIGTSKVSSDSYDVNNIFLTDQGWVYRHWKGDPASTDRYWDEIIVAGESGYSPPGDLVDLIQYSAEGAGGGSKLVATPTYEVAAGDAAYDIQYSPSYVPMAPAAADRYPYPVVVTSSASAPTPSNVTLVFTGADGTSSYTSAGGANASVSIEAGGTLTITNNTGGHPVDVRVSDEGATVSTGTLTGAPAGPGESLTWDTTGVTPGTYYYQCTAHATMIGQIIVT